MNNTSNQVQQTKGGRTRRVANKTPNSQSNQSNQTQQTSSTTTRTRRVVNKTTKQPSVQQTVQPAVQQTVQPAVQQTVQPAVQPAVQQTVESAIQQQTKGNRVRKTANNKTGKQFVKSKQNEKLNNTTNEQTEQEQLNNKAGRTLLVKSSSANSIQESSFSNLEGVVSMAKTKSSNSLFLTFDTVVNAVKAFTTINVDSSYNVKFSYYRVFFTIDGLTDTTDYNQVKKEFTEYVSNLTKSNVLYCKLYRKNNKYIGCGDFTVDTLEGMNSLLAKDNNNKEYSFGSFKGTFYRFNGNKNQNQNQNQKNSNQPEVVN